MISVYDSVNYDEFNINELYKALKIILNDLDKLEITNQHRALLRYKQETEMEIESYQKHLEINSIDIIKIEEILDYFDHNDEQNKELLKDANDKYGIAKGNRQRCNFAIEVYTNCLNIIDKRILYLLPHISKHNFNSVSKLLENSESKFHLINKKIHFNIKIIDMVYIVVGLNENNVFVNKLSEIKLRKFFELHFREFCKSNIISVQTLKNNFGQANNETIITFTKNEIMLGTHLGSLGAKNFSKIVSQNDLLRLIYLVDVLMSTENL